MQHREYFSKRVAARMGGWVDEEEGLCRCAEWGLWGERQQQSGTSATTLAQSPDPGGRRPAPSPQQPRELLTAKVQQTQPGPGLPAFKVSEEDVAFAGGAAASRSF